MAPWPCALALPLTLALPLALALTLALPLTLALTLTLTLALTLPLALPLALPLTLALTLTRARARAPCACPWPVPALPARPRAALRLPLALLPCALGGLAGPRRRGRAAHPGAATPPPTRSRFVATCCARPRSAPRPSRSRADLRAGRVALGQALGRVVERRARPRRRPARPSPPARPAAGRDRRCCSRRHLVELARPSSSRSSLGLLRVAVPVRVGLAGRGARQGAAQRRQRRRPLLVGRVDLGADVALDRAEPARG